MKYKVSLFLLTIISSYKFIQANGITYELNGGRFGDCIMTYAKAKSLSLKYNVPFFYVPFPYSDRLMLDVFEMRPQRAHPNLTRFKLFNERQIAQEERQNILFVMSYYTPLTDWNDWQHNMFPKKYDERLRRELRRHIKPRIPVPLLPIPAGTISVALHVRKGGGFDMPLLTEQTKIDKPVDKFHYVDIDFPLKFPPDQYYIDQLKALSEYFNDNPMYVYIFTDDKDPGRLVDKYAKALNKSNISFDFRKTGNAHNEHVIEDFFSMTQCDCLIRGDSSYSRAAHLIG